MLKSNKDKNTRRKGQERHSRYGRTARWLSIAMVIIFALTTASTALPKAAEGENAAAVENATDTTAAPKTEEAAPAEVTPEAATATTQEAQTATETKTEPVAETKAEPAKTETASEAVKASAAETPAPTATPEAPQAFDKSVDVKESDKDTLTVKATADAGVLPNGTELNVTPVTKEDQNTSAAYDKVAEKVNQTVADGDREATGFLAYDISFIKDNQEVQPNGYVNIKMTWDKAAAIGTTDKDSEISVLRLLKNDDYKVTNLTDIKKATVETNDDKAVTKADMSVLKSGVITFAGTKAKAAEADENAAAAGEGHASLDEEKVKIDASYGVDAGLPQNTKLAVNRVEKNDYSDAAQNALGDGVKIADEKYYDIHFENGDKKEIEPKANVNVTITLSGDEKIATDNKDVKVLHFDKDKNAEVVQDAKVETKDDKQVITFASNSFSVYGILGTEKGTGNVLTATGDGYKVTITYDADAGIPEDATLEVKEITGKNKEKYVDKTNDLVYGKDSEGSVSFSRFFDITILDKEGKKIEPKKAVKVDIAADGTDEITGDVNVIHFKDNGSESIPAERNSNGSIEYKQESFSVVGLYEAKPMKAGETLLADAATSDIDGPAHSKTLKDNGDGTYDITLSVTGKSSSSTTKSKADVVIVFDKSDSMQYPVKYASDTGRYGWRLKDTTYYQLYKKVNYRTNYPYFANRGDGNDVFFEPIQNGDNASTVYRIIPWGSGSFTGYFGYEFNGPRYTETDASNDGSPEIRLTTSQNAINELASELLSNNNGVTDANEANVTLSLVTFAGNATTEIERTTSAQDFQNHINSVTTAESTNWEDALMKANSIQTREGAEKYIIFVSDGNPTKYGNGASNEGTGYETDDNINTCYNQALTQLKGNDKNFYGVGVFGSVDRMQGLVSSAGSDSSHYQVATDQESLNAAFSKIVKSITNSSTFKNITMTDHVTDLSAMQMVNGDVTDFTYTQNGKSWTDAPKASFSSTKGTGKTVTWNLGDTLVENGVTYAVSFKVWPSQEAYDLVAELNNGTKKYDELSKSLRDQITSQNGTYYLQTNTGDNGITYSKVDTTTDSDGNTKTDETRGTSTFDNPEPGMILHSVKLKVMKSWNDSAYTNNRPSSISMQVMEDGQNYGNALTLNDENNWSQEIYIAPGIYVTPGDHGTASSDENAGVLEDGHTYTVEEVVNNYHYELSVEPTHPMLNGTTTNDTNDLINLLSKSETYENGEATITATNTLRGGVEISKKAFANDGKTDISTQDGVKDKAFTFKLDTLTLPSDYSLTSTDSNYIGSDYVKNGTFAVWAEKYNVNRTLDGKSYQISQGDTFTLNPGEMLRLTNLPIGTKYSVSEETTPGYDLFQVKAGTNGGNKAALGNNTTVASGTTTGNTNYEYEFDNKQKTTSIVIKKTTDDYQTLLGGSTFNLYKKDANGTYVQVTGANATLQPNATNGVKLENLEVGDYKLTETHAPDGYIVETADTYFTVDIGSDGKAVITEATGENDNTHAKVDESNPDTLLIGNKAGQALPNTGGHGTLPFVLGGMFLISAAGMLYIISKKRSALN